MHFNNETSLINITKVVIQSSLSDLVSYFVREVVVTVNLAFFGELIGLFGMTGNIVNIIVFIKQGFNDTINVSLVALSLADFGALITIQWFSICVNPWFLSADLPFLPLEIQSLTAGYPHVYFIRVTGFITAFISCERCICVVFPLKVKNIITKRFLIFYNIAIFLVMILGIFPVYYTAYYDWKFHHKSNKTKLGIFYTANKDQVLQVSLMITNFGVPLFSFIIILASTAVTGVVLKRKSKWRKSASGATITSGCAINSSNNSVSTKERKVIVMISTLSVIFIVSLLPMTIVLAVRAVEPGLSINGKYANMNWLVVSVAFLLETINSSINSVIFYKMSSKYRDTIHKMFSIRTGAE